MPRCMNVKLRSPSMWSTCFQHGHRVRLGGNPIGSAREVTPFVLLDDPGCDGDFQMVAPRPDATPVDKPRDTDATDPSQADRIGLVQVVFPYKV